MPKQLCLQGTLVAAAVWKTKKNDRKKKKKKNEQKNWSYNNFKIPAI